MLHNFAEILEKVKKVCRKVRRSGIKRKQLMELQHSLDLPEHVLIKVVQYFRLSNR